MITRHREYAEVRCDHCHSLAFRVTPNGLLVTQCRKEKRLIEVPILTFAPWADLVAAAGGIRAQRRAGQEPLKGDLAALDRALAALEAPGPRIWIEEPGA